MRPCLPRALQIPRHSRFSKPQPGRMPSILSCQCRARSVQPCGACLLDSIVRALSTIIRTLGTLISTLTSQHYQYHVRCRVARRLYPLGEARRNTLALPFHRILVMLVRALKRSLMLPIMLLRVLIILLRVLSMLLRVLSMLLRVLVMLMMLPIMLLGVLSMLLVPIRRP